MGKGIIKIKDKYLEWSTVWDKPITRGMSLDELREYIKDKYGSTGLSELPERLERVEKYRTSFICDHNLGDTICGNRAGENETNISAKKIYQRYCTGKLLRNGTTLVNRF